eukprot:CAMPEP_0183331262 /NCGR_PEP_ID=MMETSP0164_2-20130417/642_1 /TAXON_ID=221442 /ORGANISM="Coccolithus pelagicus ssp braarudi, Strain PLY182g" /LENGTH=72 /DNA_ID=CAMNT_0025499685 /DNA_START=184 /DNA_END=402 /DNA_ORIENTATION=+
MDAVCIAGAWPSDAREERPCEAEASQCMNASVGALASAEAEAPPVVWQARRFTAERASSLPLWASGGETASA